MSSETETNHSNVGCHPMSDHFQINILATSHYLLSNRQRGDHYSLLISTHKIDFKNLKREYTEDLVC